MTMVYEYVIVFGNSAAESKREYFKDGLKVRRKKIDVLYDPLEMQKGSLRIL